MSNLSFGSHYLINFYGCEYNQINNKKDIEIVLFSSVNKRKVKVLHKFFYKFNPQGVTGFLLLSASHIAIHTWPEKKYAAVDIFTCINEKETKKIIASITKTIHHKNAEIIIHKRGFLTNQD
jgi:S-adenosylmethionine decarboxylase